VRRRFFWSLVAVAVATIVVGSLAAAILIDREVDRSVREEFRRQAQATAGLVDSQILQRPGGRGPQVDVISLLGVVTAVGGHDYVEAAFIDQAGNLEVLGQGGPLLDQVPGDLARVSRSVEFEATVDGESVAAFATPVDLNGRGQMVIVIGTDLDIIPWRDVALRMLFGVALGLTLASLIAGSLSRFLGSRLEGLSGASRALAAGDLTARAPVEGDDEIGEVAVAFNDMAGQLEEARRREREFLQSVGHDLRTPLTTIGGYAEALEEGNVDAADLPRVADVIHRESGRLSRLVEDLMMLSRIEAREFGLRPEEVDLAAHLAGSVEAFRVRAEAAGIVLESDLEPMPPVETDPDRVDQIVGNLLENALRYTPEGGSVTLRLQSGDSGYRIAVTDSGPGMDPDDLPRVFDRLYVTQRYRPLRPEGSGLGLAIVKELVGLMGGTTGVDSAIGSGTTVYAILPHSGSDQRSG